MAQSERKSRSPYAKHGKAPYRYSEAYQRWAKSVGDAGAGIESEETYLADKAFRRLHGVTGQ